MAMSAIAQHRIEASERLSSSEVKSSSIKIALGIIAILAGVLLPIAVYHANPQFYNAIANADQMAYCFTGCMVLMGVTLASIAAYRCYKTQRNATLAPRNLVEIAQNSSRREQNYYYDQAVDRAYQTGEDLPTLLESLKQHYRSSRPLSADLSAKAAENFLVIGERAFKDKDSALAIKSLRESELYAKLDADHGMMLLIASVQSGQEIQAYNLFKQNNMIVSFAKHPLFCKEQPKIRSRILALAGVLEYSNAKYKEAGAYFKAAEAFSTLECEMHLNCMAENYEYLSLKRDLERLDAKRRALFGSHIGASPISDRAKEACYAFLGYVEYFKGSKEKATTYLQKVLWGNKDYPRHPFQASYVIYLSLLLSNGNEKEAQQHLAYSTLGLAEAIVAYDIPNFPKSEKKRIAGFIAASEFKKGHYESAATCLEHAKPLIGREELMSLVCSVHNNSILCDELETRFNALDLTGIGNDMQSDIGLIRLTLGDYKMREYKSTVSYAANALKQLITGNLNFGNQKVQAINYYMDALPSLTAQDIKAREEDFRLLLDESEPLKKLFVEEGKAKSLKGHHLDAAFFFLMAIKGSFDEPFLTSATGRECVRQLTSALEKGIAANSASETWLSLVEEAAINWELISHSFEVQIVHYFDGGAKIVTPSLGSDSVEDLGVILDYLKRQLKP